MNSDEDDSDYQPSDDEEMASNGAYQLWEDPFLIKMLIPYA